MSRRSAAPRRMHIVAVCYQARPDQFAARLRSLASSSGFVLQGVLVCNNPAHAGTARAGELDCLQGSNALLDFSGYFEGLDHLLHLHPEAAAGNVLFVNDTLVFKHAPASILGRVLGLDALLSKLQVPAIAGKADPYRSICVRNPWSGEHRYVTTFCFMLNALALPNLRALMPLAAADDLLSEASLADEAWGRRLPSVFREHIMAHLVYEGSPYLWPGAATSSAELVRKKACCVYFESRLSGAIGRDGALVPINAGPRSSSAIFLRELLAGMGRVLKLPTS